MSASKPTRAAEMASGLRALADMIEANPGAVDDFRYLFDNLLLPVYDKEPVRRLARLGVRSGAAVTKHQNNKYAGVDLRFSASVNVHVYVEREKVCERIVTGTRKVTENVPDPDALAAIPLVTVTKTVEDVEWRCVPLLADEKPAPRTKRIRAKAKPADEIVDGEVVDAILALPAGVGA